MTVAESANPIARRILDAATELFAGKGFAAASTREIVEAAGVTKPMLYYYFQSKEGLCRAALAGFFDSFHQQMRELLVEEMPPRQFLINVVWIHLEHCERNRNCARLFFSLLFGPEEYVELFELEKYTDVSSDFIRASVKRACDADLVRAECQDTMYTALTGIINLSVMAGLRERGEAMTKESTERIIDDLLVGFGRRASH